MEGRYRVRANPGDLICLYPGCIGGRGQVDDWFKKYHDDSSYSSGPACCAADSISFHYVGPTEALVLYDVTTHPGKYVRRGEEVCCDDDCLPWVTSRHQEEEQVMVDDGGGGVWSQQNWCGVVCSVGMVVVMMAMAALVVSVMLIWGRGRERGL